MIDKKLLPYNKFPSFTENPIDAIIGCKSFRESMLSGLAFHRFIYDEHNVPIDYEYIEINKAFEDCTGLKRENVIGKRLTEIIPDIQKDTTNWIQKFATCARYEKTVIFEEYSETLGRYYKISAFSPLPDYFVAMMEDITEQKKQDELLAMYHEITQTSKICFLTCQLENERLKIIYFNYANEFINNKTIKNIEGKTIEMIFPLYHKSGMSNLIKQVISTQKDAYLYNAYFFDEITLLDIYVSPLKNKCVAIKFEKSN